MRVILADDHDLVRDAIKTYIETLEPEAQVRTASDLDEAVRLAGGDDPLELILLDLNMPGMNGFEGLERMRALKPDVPVAILSGTTDRKVVMEAIERGAASFIPKTLSGARLLNVLHLVISGETYVPVNLMSGPEAAAAEPEKPALTKREQEVLNLLAEGASNKEIARSLGLQEVTVKLHLRGLFRKLDAKNRTQAVTAALAQGLVSQAGA